VSRASVQDEASQLAALALARAAGTAAGQSAAQVTAESAAQVTAESAGRGTGQSDAQGLSQSSGQDRGAWWLDTCAGPGGKARLLAGLAGGYGARLVAADVRPHRARLVRAGVGGIPGTGVIVADGTVPAWRLGSFGGVLTDVPCSGLGALRRRPEARWRRSPADIAALGPLQRGLLAAALDSAAPGGVVAYVTCSPHKAETRDVVADVTGGRGDIQILDAPAVLPEVPGLRCPEPHGSFAQFWPHRHGTDAIFLALLQRRA
jgi:16S rRNA (cytosine967-C5)-methyltransferase